MPHRLDRRATRRRYPVGQSGEAVCRTFVVVADRFAHHRDFGGGVPVFETGLAISNLIARDAHRAATGKLECLRLAVLHRRRNRGDDRFSHATHPDANGLRRQRNNHRATEHWAWPVRERQPAGDQLTGRFRLQQRPAQIAAQEYAAYPAAGMHRHRHVESSRRSSCARSMALPPPPSPGMNRTERKTRFVDGLEANAGEGEPCDTPEQGVRPWQNSSMKDRGPLGGIGSGCIGLAGDGRLVDWEISTGRTRAAPTPRSRCGTTRFPAR